MKRTLVLGFGNPYRRDDGAGRAVVNALRRSLGQPALDPLDDGFDGLGRAVDTVNAHQLVPELAQILGPYALAIFVDAHAGEQIDPLSEERIAPRPHASAVTHHLHPGTLLDLARRIHGRAPEGILLSLRGHDFDFGETLSPATARLVPEAVSRIRVLVGDPVACGSTGSSKATR